MDYSEKWANSVDDAVKLALIDLRLTIEEVEVIVLEEPSRGFFGIGSKLAKVRVERKKTETKKEAPAKTPSFTVAAAKELVPESPVKKERPQPKEKKPVSKTRPEKREKRVERERTAVEKVTQERPENLQAVTEHSGISFIREITEKMGLVLDVTAAANEEVIYIDMEGKDSGTVIGKRGQTLDSIQYLTSLVVNKDREKYVRVVVDAESYRAKREKTLEQLANRLADKVIRTKKSVRLEPMNPYERKVIHATLQSNPHIMTRSEGEEPYRRVIIELKVK